MLLNGVKFMKILNELKIYIENRSIYDKDGLFCDYYLYRLLIKKYID